MITPLNPVQGREGRIDSFPCPQEKKCLDFHHAICYVSTMFNKQFKKRFWDKVKIGSKKECWLWTASTNKRGQGQFRVHYGRQMDVTSRVSWMIHSEKWIPKGLWVLHHCDNPSCVNPDHLWLGTPKDNTQDMLKKGRHRTRSPKGENQWNAVLTEKDIEWIRVSRLSQQEIANSLGISQAHVSRIKLRQSWKHVNSL